jgi:3-oxoacyl-[acyl-carrier-protein] synthase II
MRRIAITGYGTINALGAGAEVFERGLRDGRCAIGPLTVLPREGFRSQVAAEVKEMVLPPGIPSPLSRRASRTSRLALIAADEALRMASLDTSNRELIGVVLGTTTGGLGRGEESYRRMQSGQQKAPRISGWLEAPVSVAADALAHTFACDGPRLTVSTACSSSANALGIAADWIRWGRAEAVLCGGADSLCWTTYSGFNVLQALDTVACRPFDRRRAGLTLGEGSAMFVLEDWERAQLRGAAIAAELVSYGVSADAHHLTQPRPDGQGAMSAMRRALRAGGVEPEEIDYINAHGTGTPLNDVAETKAIKAVFGAHAYRIPVTSTKSMVGHCLAAAGAIETLASVLAMRGGFVPPTATLEEADPECDLDYVPGASRPAALRTVLSNSYGFGGNNTSVVLRSRRA